ncbi:hypothetical protein [Nocardia arthritidis]|uniref:Uncharacterized protein n=1 Tax=Nocardia arthritidis TaxID=228602 RepID=A0A6G9YT86_9NOCA|nr:hypothetical protein [Nocardia arthritidis]QIS16311.1 hypothetical protein F5544_42510 [Nocardia arthritidis]
MRRSRPDDEPLDYREHLQAEFNIQFTNAMAGKGVSMCTDLDLETQEVLARIAGHYPDIPPELIDAAHAVFAGQLDGSRDDEDIVPSFVTGRATNE